MQQQAQNNSHKTATHLPRSEWSKHPKFPTQALLLGSHDNFREISQYILRLVGEENRIAYAKRLFSSWMTGMRGHEHYEEKKLFRYLSRRFQVSIEKLQDGHDQLHQREDEVRAAFEERLRQQEVEGSNSRLLQALQDHRSTLLEHLWLEENTVIPLLLSMTSEEFNEYYHSGIHHLMVQLDQKQTQSVVGNPTS